MAPIEITPVDVLLVIGGSESLSGAKSVLVGVPEKVEEPGRYTMVYVEFDGVDVHGLGPNQMVGVRFNALAAVEVSRWFSAGPDVGSGFHAQFTHPLTGEAVAAQAIIPARNVHMACVLTARPS